MNFFLRFICTFFIRHCDSIKAAPAVVTRGESQSKKYFQWRKGAGEIQVYLLREIKRPIIISR